MIDERMGSSAGTSDAHTPPQWGFLGWARWLPDLANAAIVGIAVFAAIANLVSYSDDEIRQSLVDTYEPSVWTFMAVCVCALIGAVIGLITRGASRHPTRRRIAAFQVALMVATVGVAAYGHHRLMLRTTQLTGQTFGGFP